MQYSDISTMNVILPDAMMATLMAAFLFVIIAYKAFRILRVAKLQLAELPKSKLSVIRTIGGLSFLIALYYFGDTLMLFDSMPSLDRNMNFIGNIILGIWFLYYMISVEKQDIPPKFRSGKLPSSEQARTKK